MRMGHPDREQEGVDAPTDQSSDNASGGEQKQQLDSRIKHVPLPYRFHGLHEELADAGGEDGGGGGLEQRVDDPAGQGHGVRDEGGDDPVDEGDGEISDKGGEGMGDVLGGACGGEGVEAGTVGAAAGG